MADLTTEFLGIRSPNPFWLASAPPTDKAYNVNRAFEAGWGGAVWKTLGEDPPIVNVSGPRYGAMHGNDRRVLGFNPEAACSQRALRRRSTHLVESGFRKKRNRRLRGTDHPAGNTRLRAAGRAHRSLR